MKRAVIALYLLVAALPASGDTVVSGTITANTTWTVAGSPYILSGDVRVEGSASPVLTIEAGVVVKANSAAQLLVNNQGKGAVVANGTAASPILFTSNVATPAPGAWYGVYVGSVTGAPLSSMTHVTIEYAGSVQWNRGGLTTRSIASSFTNVTARNNAHAGISVHGGADTFEQLTMRANAAGVVVHGGSPVFRSSSIADNAGPGINAVGGTTITLTDVAITGNSGAAITLSPMTELAGMTGLTATGNGLNAVEYRAGDISANRTWRTCPLPYVVTGSIFVRSSTSPILTIEPGNTIRFNANSQIAVNSQYRGGLAANGTAAAPILFTSNADTPAAGAWYGLYFGDYSGGPASSVSHATIEYGGHISSMRGGITTYIASPSFSNITIRNNLHAGIAVHGGTPSFDAVTVRGNPTGVAVHAGSPAITNSTITENAGPGINSLATGAITVTLTDVAITGNTAEAITLNAMTALGGMTGLTATGNGLNAVEYRAGDISAHRTWRTSPLPYVVDGSIFVRSSTSPILTIEPGNTIRFNANSQIAVNSQYRGGLAANGTAAAPILFTSNADTPAAGSWYGLYFGDYSGGPASSVSHATIEYGGHISSMRGGITTYIASPSFSNITIRNNLHAGIAVHGGTPSFDAVTVRGNPTGVAVHAGSPAITNSTITENAGPGINSLATGAITVTVTDVAITSNTAEAITLNAMTALAGMTGLTATGNGLNAVEYRAGEISTHRTWRTCPLPYVVDGSIYVRSSTSPILTIEPGNTIRFNSGGQIAVNYQYRGGLAANGTAAAPILFTSNAATPAAGAWQGLYFGDYSSGPASSVSHATIEYGGAGTSRGGITSFNGSSFSNVTIRNNVYAGIAVHGGTPSFDAVTVRGNPTGVVVHAGSPAITNSTITENAGPGVNSIATGAITVTVTDVAITGNTAEAITLNAMTALAGMTGLTATGNGLNAVEYRAGEISTHRTWRTCPLPYVVDGSIYVRSSTSPILTIEPGNTIRFNSGAQIAVNYQYRGGLVANGTAEAPILFTSNSASPAAGAWLGLYFGDYSSGPASSVSHATIEYGGAGTSRGGITSFNGSSFSNVTIRNNVYAGIAVHGGTPSFDAVTVRGNPTGVVVHAGSPTLTNSTITENAGPGINSIATGAITVSLTDVAITGNTAEAITLNTMAELAGMTGLTATGNGLNAVEYRAGEISTNRTWRTSPLPYVVDGSIYVRSSTSPILTIEPGNTIRFNNASQIYINHQYRGGLAANGTAEAPILFTSSAATPVAGSWYGLYFGNYSSGPPSSMAHAIVEYGGLASSSRGGITVTGGSPTFAWMSIRNNAFAGMNVTGGQPLIEKSQFHANPAGILASGTAVVEAPLNSWAAAAGPCAVGGCTDGQQSASPAVSYEPWLLTPPVTTHYFDAVTHKDRTFSTAAGAETTIAYVTSVGSDVALTVRDQSGTVIRTLSGSGTPGSLSWDGRNASGQIQPDGTYTYELTSAAAGLDPAATAKGRAVLDSGRTLTLTQPTVAPALFSPNGDGLYEQSVVTASTNYDETTWTVSVVDGANNVVRQQSGTGTPISYAWDGRDSASVVQPDGVYTLRIDVTVGTSTLQKGATTTLDNTPATVAIAAPAEGQTQSNVYTAGVTDFAVTGTTTDPHMLNWTLQAGLGAAPPTWTTIGSGTTSVTDATLGTWKTAALANGNYSLRLQATDRAGNAGTATVFPVPLGNFKAAQNKYEFNVATGGTVQYTSTVPFALDETIVVKNEAGSVVRNLITALSRAAGTYTDHFDGRNDAGALLPDGPYFYFATVTDGTHTFTWDLSKQFRNDYNAYNDGLTIPAYDPFNNKPMTFNFNFTQPGRFWVATSTNSGSVRGICTQPSSTFYCPVINEWHPSGTHTFTWSGIDHTGAYRPIRSVAINMLTGAFPKNAAVMFGGKPAVKNVKVTPPVFGPAVGTQTVEADLTSFQTQPMDVAIAFVNMSSNSTLRTVSLPAQPAGRMTATWDGRADNGMLVAPGRYRVIVTATDAHGNVVSRDILTTIKY